MAQKEKSAPPRVTQGIDKVGGLLTEQCRVYRAARRGEISTADGYKLMMMLDKIRGTIDASDIEERLRELESRVN